MSISTPYPPKRRNSPSLINVAYQLSILLCGENHLAWRTQFPALLLTRFDLYSYVDGIIVCKVKTLVIAEPTTKNLVYLHWVSQDKLILHELESSITTTMMGLLGTITISHKACEILNRVSNCGCGRGCGYCGRCDVYCG